MGGKRQGGFTVIEMLVTVAILTIIIAMGVPMYGQFSRSSEMSGRTSEFLSGINLARSEAVNQRRVVEMAAIGGDWNSGWNISRQVDGVLLQTADFRAAGHNRVGIAEGADLTTLAFDREGRLTSGGAFVDAAFTLCPNDGQPGPGRTINISRFGRVQLVTTACP